MKYIFLFLLIGFMQIILLITLLNLKTDVVTLTKLLIEEEDNKHPHPNYIMNTTSNNSLHQQINKK